MTKRITIDLNEYESLLNELEEKDKLIDECVHDGRIRFKTVEKFIFSSYGYRCDLRFAAEEYHNLSECEINDIQSKEVKLAIKDINRAKDRWAKDYEQEVEKGVLERMKDKTQLDMLVYLFTGKF